MNEEILSGIKNAIAHGSSLDEAAQSFINAGYNSGEVHEIVEYLKTPSPVVPQANRQVTSSTSQQIASNQQQVAKAGSVQQSSSVHQTQAQSFPVPVQNTGTVVPIKPQDSAQRPQYPVVQYRKSTNGILLVIILILLLLIIAGTIGLLILNAQKVIEFLGG